LNITKKKLADHLGCDMKVNNRIVNNRTSICAKMAVKLGSSLVTLPEFRLNAQHSVDASQAKRKVRNIAIPRSELVLFVPLLVYFS
jgi:addiction module HigA family antidote